MNPRIATATALFAALLAVLLLWVLSPSSEPLAPPPSPRAVAVAPAPRATPSAVPYALRPKEPVADTATTAEKPVVVPLAMPFRQVMPRAPLDPDRIYDAELSGIASAMLDRQERLVGCYRAHVDTHGPVQGRPTLRATVLPDDGSSERFEIQVENEGQGLADLDACLLRSMSDAQFSDVPIPSTVLYPLPLAANF